jgi:hypothetical protein
MHYWRPDELIDRTPTHIFRTIIAESRPDPGCLEVPYRALGSAMAVVQGIVIRLDE